ncbi:MAG: Saxitoxin biosynthesis operon protein SxtJ [Verrucomicrobiota bacterium]|jgi:ribose/xylose/arabinose/galactoside ABC-type transport system permease subunit
MRLRLKEDPREWRKFAWALSGALAVLAGVVVWRRHGFTQPSAVLLAFSLAVMLIGSLFPRLFRPVYRVAMRFSHAMGQVMGRVMLTVMFLLFITPLAWLLRLSGKRLLAAGGWRRDSGQTGYWVPARKAGPLERLF